MPKLTRMPQFILIEPSLRNLGGHHFEYAFEIVYAAEEAGYQPILAVNRDFEERDRFPSNWKAFPLFPYRSDRIHRIPKAASLALGEHLLRADIGATIGGLADRFKSKISGLRWRRRMTRVDGFARACERLFENVTLESGDQVYCCTMSDMDLLGLVRFLETHPKSQLADWHLQFHFGVFNGRDPEYENQIGKVRRLRRRFETAVQALPDHKLHFYTTTDELRRQFNRLGAAEFQTLPWPVSGRFQPAQRPTDAAAPLRLVCAGGVRREKGGELVGPLVAALDNEFLNPNKVQLLIQTGKKRKLRKMLGLDPGVATEIAEYCSDELPQSSVVALPHPLPPDAYADLIRSADIGLLLYDSDEYFARCSGILVELLAAGVPVIGPAGCWLGEQIERANHGYLQNLLRNSVTVHHWNLEQAAPRVIDGRHGDTCELDLESFEGDLLVRLMPSPSAACGTYAGVNLKQFSADGEKTMELTTVVAAGGENQTNGSLLTTLFPIDANTARVRLTTTSAYRIAPSPVRQLDAHFIMRADGEPRHQPMGRVGLTMSSPKFIPLLLRDIVENYDHYRTSAAQFAVEWRHNHAPARTIEQLTAKPKAIKAVALRPAS